MTTTKEDILNYKISLCREKIAIAIGDGEHEWLSSLHKELKGLKKEVVEARIQSEKIRLNEKAILEEVNKGNLSALSEYSLEDSSLEEILADVISACNEDSALHNALVRNLIEV